MLTELWSEFCWVWIIGTTGDVEEGDDDPEKIIKPHFNLSIYKPSPPISTFKSVIFDKLLFWFSVLLSGDDDDEAIVSEIQ